MMPVLAVLGGLALVVGLWLIINYNRLARLRQHVRESWSDIDVELRRRYALVPNLVETVRGYAAHERELLDEVTRLRSLAMENRGTAASQATDETAMQAGLRKLFAVVESYPDLKADRSFRALQTELANTEDRIAAARRFYNGNVREMTQLCETVPTNVVAGLFGFMGGDYFELDEAAERVVPRVEL